MTPAPMGRVVVMSLAMIFASVMQAAGHALPGSLLTLDRDAGGLTLTIELPLEDLIIAEPGFAALAELDGHADLPAEHRVALASYFADHLSLRHPDMAEGASVALSLQEATLQEREDHHRGIYVLVVARFVAAWPESDPLWPLELHYDAVMHEVRNHRATVFWAPQDGAAVGLADFGYETARQGRVVLQPE